MSSLRSVFSLSLVCVICLVCVGTTTAQNRDLAKEKVLYAVGYAHLDTQWRWDYQTTIDQYIWNTMADNFSLIEKYPDYIFNFSGANRYKMMKEYYPQEFEKVKRLAAAGRWFPAGSSMEENDALATSHESILRQILLGTRFFRKELGVASAEYMLPDCFGFPASLPSILAHCGLKGFSTQKLEWGSAVGIPFNVGRWIGPDGESVVAALNPGAYVTQVRGDLSTGNDWVKRINDAGATYGTFADYMYFGTGDVGGAPDEESVQWVEKSIRSGKEIKVVSAKSDQMFKDITPQQKAKLPAYKGEFLLTNHSAGSITSAAFMKRMNRKNELLAAKTEAASVMAEWLGGAAYDQSRMNEAWRLALGAQFHDILPGTSIPRAYEFAWNDELLAANQFGNILADASGAVIRAMDTNGQGVPVVVYNPLSTEREDAVEAALTFAGAVPKAVRVYDRAGREVPSQVAKVEGENVTVVFLAKIPSVGYALFDVRPSDVPCTLATGLKATASTLENGRYLVKLNADGDVAGIYDKSAKKEILAAPARLEFHYERPQDWPAWNQDWEDRQKPALGYVEGPAKVTIVENGPARVALQVERESRHSRIVQVIRLTADGSADRVEFATHIDWASRECSLKAAFPLTVSNPEATYSFGVGTVMRGNNNPKKFEVPSHQWFDLTGKEGSYGVSILEDGKYGSDKPADDIVRLTLLYTPGVRNSYREQAYQDLGEHDFLYALCGHKGDWRTGNSNLHAARLNQPLVCFKAPAHKGPLGRAFSFLAISDPDVVLSALKKAEDGKDLIVRIVETKGRAAKGVEVSFAAPVVSAKELNGVEDEIGPAETRNGKLVFDVTPYHLKTFAVRLKPYPSPLSPAQGTPVELPYNVDVISYDGHKADGDFDSLGASFPAEMLPNTIVSEGVPFRLGPKADGAANAVACQGQTVRLPDGKFNRVYMLAAASRPQDGRARDSANRYTFKLGEMAVEVPVQDWSGFIGQWDKRSWAGDKTPLSDEELNAAEYAGLAPAYLKKDNVAFFTTHRHRRDGANEAYAYAYLFRYRFDLPADTRTITFPGNDAIKVLAMTAAWNENDAASPAEPLSDTLDRRPADMTRFAACAKPAITPARAFVDYGRPLVVVMAAKEAGAEIRYTLDGTTPASDSMLYSGPLSLDKTAVLKAVAFDKVKMPSAEAVAYFSRSFPIRSVHYLVQPAPRRGRGPVNEEALIDLLRGTVDSYANWQWFNKVDLDIILDLGQVRTVTDVGFRALENNNSWVFLPVGVEIAASVDGKDYRTVASERYDVPEKAGSAAVKELLFDLKGVAARYLHVVARNVGALPKWHRNAGQSALMAVDEIIIR